MKIIALTIAAAFVLGLFAEAANSATTDDLSERVDVCESSNLVPAQGLARCLSMPSARFRLRCEFHEYPEQLEACSQMEGDLIVVYLWQQRRHPSRFYAVHETFEAACVDAAGNDLIRQHVAIDVYSRVRCSNLGRRSSFVKLFSSSPPAPAQAVFSQFRLAVGKARHGIATAVFKSVATDEQGQPFETLPIAGVCSSRP